MHLYNILHISIVLHMHLWYVSLLMSISLCIRFSMRTYIITDIRLRTCQYILYTCAFPCICTNTFIVAYSSVLLSYLIIQYLSLSMCYLVLSFFCHTQVCFLLCYYTYVSTLLHLFACPHRTCHIAYIYCCFTVYFPSSAPEHTSLCKRVLDLWKCRLSSQCNLIQSFSLNSVL